MATGSEILRALVEVALQAQASDIHIRSGEAPSYRLKGELVPTKAARIITQDEILDICKNIFPPEVYANLKKTTDFDAAYEVEGLCRLRYNFVRYSSKIGLIVRLVSKGIRTIEELGLNPVLKNIVKNDRGLILVTGASGQGKSTTVAAMINELNETATKHIVTIEDPIEFLHTSKKSRITQREIGTDVLDFHIALRSALRQDPDIIFIGELRDRETVEIALKAAETGHLVLATIHTTDAVATIARVVSMFSPDEAEYVKNRLADALFATVSQRMIKSEKSSSGIVIAQEIMVTGPGIRDCIKGKEPLDRIIPILEKGGTNMDSFKCQSFDQHIFSLFSRGVITHDDALVAVRSKVDFERKIVGGEIKNS